MENRQPKELLTKDKFLKLFDMFYRWFWIYLTAKQKLKISENKVEEDKIYSIRRKRFVMMKKILHKYKILKGSKSNLSYGTAVAHFVGKVCLNGDILKNLSNIDIIVLLFKYMILVNESLFYILIRSFTGGNYLERVRVRDVNLYYLSKHIYFLKAEVLRELKRRNLNIDFTMLKKILYEKIVVDSDPFKGYVQWLIDKYYIDDRENLLDIIDSGFLRIINNMGLYYSNLEYKKKYNSQRKEWVKRRINL